TIIVTLTSDIIIYPGEYTVVYSASDSSGNTTTKTRYVTVIDVGYPVITILGNNPITINVENAYTDLGATAYDEVDGDITVDIITTGTVNVNVVGTYTVKYTVSDKAGNETIATRTVNVIDNVSPIITFGTNGNSTYAKSHNTTVTVIDAHGTVLYRYYQWTTSTTAPSSASFTTTFTNDATLTSPAGVTGGYYLWIKGVDNSGNERIERSNVFNLDNTIPTITFGTNGNSAYAKSHNTTVTVSDTHGTVASRQYQWTTSTTVPSTGSFTTTFTNGGTINTPGGVTGGYYLWIKGVDSSGNELISRSNVFNLDNTIPTIAFGTNGNSVYAKSHNTTVTVSDTHGTVASRQYQWTTSTTAPSSASFTTTFTNGATLNNPAGVTGGYYLWIKGVDNSGNERIGRSNVFNLDNAGPTVPTGGSIGSVSGSNTTGTIATVASGSSDAHSGILAYKYLVTNNSTVPANTNTGFTTSRNFTRSCGTTYYGWAIAEDKLGNKSSVRSLGNTADGANSYSGWSSCSKSCGGGTQTRTNSCLLITTGLSQSCNTQACCTPPTGACTTVGQTNCGKTCTANTVANVTKTCETDYSASPIDAYECNSNSKPYSKGLYSGWVCKEPRIRCTNDLYQFNCTRTDLRTGIQYIGCDTSGIPYQSISSYSGWICTQATCIRKGTWK
ncbi:MAG: DUF5011 domain-containing protein, partial [Bacilli bacterium]|nr:DUF5011 domain-containing protein [Bacilli bacterium]